MREYVFSGINGGIVLHPQSIFRRISSVLSTDCMFHVLYCFRQGFVIIYLLLKRSYSWRRLPCSRAGPQKAAKIYLASFWFRYARHLARLRRRRRAYAPTSNTASHDNHEKVNSLVSFDFPWCFSFYNSITHYNASNLETSNTSVTFPRCTQRISLGLDISVVSFHFLKAIENFLDFQKLLA